MQGSPDLAEQPSEAVVPLYVREFVKQHSAQPSFRPLFVARREQNGGSAQPPSGGDLNFVAHHEPNRFPDPETTDSEIARERVEVSLSLGCR